MNPEIIATVVAAFISISGAGFMREVVVPLLKRGYKLDKPNVESHTEKLSRLTSSLTKASSEVDGVIVELAQVAQDRERSVQRLQTELASLEGREKQLQQKIQDLENVPIPVAEHFAKMIASEEKKSAWRDYALFGTGVIVTTIIAILLKHFGLG